MVACSVALSGSVRAQTAGVPAVLEGVWRRAVSPERAQSIVIAAFEPRLASYPSMLRGIARDRISGALRMPDRVAVETHEQRIRVTYFGQRRVVVDSTLGARIRVRDDDGGMRRVVQQLQGGWLHHDFRTDQGRVERLLSAEGETLHLDYTVHNEQLGAPVSWRVDYRR